MKKWKRQIRFLTKLNLSDGEFYLRCGLMFGRNIDKQLNYRNRIKPIYDNK